MEFDVLCGQERCLGLMLVLVAFLGFWAEERGVGLAPGGGVPGPARFVFWSCWVVPSVWQGFIRGGGMACIAPAWSSGKLGLKMDETQDKILL